MPHDQFGDALEVGDIVLVECRVKAIHLTEDYCNVDLEVRTPMPPLDTITTLTLNSKQVVLNDNHARVRNELAGPPDRAAEAVEAGEVLLARARETRPAAQDKE